MHMARLRTLLVLVLVPLTIAAACSDGGGEDGGSNEDALVFATTTIWADVVEQVACGAIDVPSLVPPGSDAHSYEPTVRDADRLRGARLVGATGRGLEGPGGDARDAARREGVAVHEVGASLEAHLAGEDDRAEEDGHAEEEPAEGAHDHGGEDPHVWMDPLLVAEAVPALRDALGEVEDLGVPPAELERCAADFVDQLGDLVEEGRSMLSAVPGARRRLVTDHEALGHFAARFDLEVVGAVVPSTDSLAEANPRDLDELESTMRTEGVRVVVVEHGSAQEQADALAERLGRDTRVVELHTESLGGEGAPSGYLDLIRTDVELLADALGAAS